jgi:hypothetical protein
MRPRRLELPRTIRSTRPSTLHPACRCFCPRPNRPNCEVSWTYWTDWTRWMLSRVLSRRTSTNTREHARSPPVGRLRGVEMIVLAATNARALGSTASSRAVSAVGAKPAIAAAYCFDRIACRISARTTCPRLSTGRSLVSADAALDSSGGGTGACAPWPPCSYSPGGLRRSTQQ